MKKCTTTYSLLSLYQELRGLAEGMAQLLDGASPGRERLRRIHGLLEQMEEELGALADALG